MTYQKTQYILVYTTAKQQGYNVLDIDLVYRSNNCGEFVIVEYRGAKSVDIKFLSTGYERTATAEKIRLGSVKDPHYPTVCGVGYVGTGRYTSKHIGYQKWRGMINRCYNRNTVSINPTYSEVSVCKEWHNFQNFAEWFDVNYIDGFHLDKDIKKRGNKLYSPEYCCFVSQKENTVNARAMSHRLTSPQGVDVVIYNLTEFCRNNKLTQQCMDRVSRGDSKSHKGWSKTDNLENKNG